MVNEAFDDGAAGSDNEMDEDELAALLEDDHHDDYDSEDYDDEDDSSDSEDSE